MDGHDLDYYIARAVHNEEEERLMRKLQMLAHFLAQLHGLPTMRKRVHFEVISNYFRAVVKSLAIEGVIDSWKVNEFYQLCNSWNSNTDIWNDRLVLVHGDATPTNFIFHPEEGITAIDLERMHPSDRTYDIGFIAAELKHHFAWRILQADAAESFIRYFFDAIVISSDFGFRKPDPRLFHIALAILNTPASEAVYIGNSYETDILGAKAADVALAGLIRQTENQKKASGKDIKPDFIADDLRGAFKEISESKRSMDALREKQNE